VFIQKFDIPDNDVTDEITVAADLNAGSCG
jgi:hypothetical protein